MTREAAAIAWARTGRKTKKKQKNPHNPKKNPTYTALEHLSCEQWSEEPVSVKSLERVIHIIPQNLQGVRRGLWECLKQWSQPQAAVLSTKHTGQQPTSYFALPSNLDRCSGSFSGNSITESRELGIPTVDAKVPAILHECNSPLKRRRKRVWYISNLAVKVSFLALCLHP